MVLSDGSGILDQCGFRMGDVYCEVVKACISGSFGAIYERVNHNEQELAGFCHGIVQKLESCSV